MVWGAVWLGWRSGHSMILLHFIIFLKSLSLFVDSTNEGEAQGFGGVTAAELYLGRPQWQCVSV